MKKTKIVAFILFLSLYSFAQKTTDKNIIEFGINAGLQNAHFDNYTEMTNANQLKDFRIILGGIIQYNLNKNIWISSGINFEQKGTRTKTLDKRQDIVNIRIPYLELPVLLSLAIGNNNKGYLSIGGYGSFAIVTPKFISQGITYTNTFLLTNTPIDYGSIIALGFKMKQKDFRNIFIEARYSQGFRDIRLNDIFVRNQNIGLVFGATFNKNKK